MPTHKTTYNSPAVYSTVDSPIIAYPQVVEVTGGTTLYFSGITPWNTKYQLTSRALITQLDQTLVNLNTLLEARGLTSQNLVFLRMYVAKPNYYDDLEALSSTIKRHFPSGVTCALTLIGVTGLAEPDQLFEIEATAVT